MDDFLKQYGLQQNPNSTTSSLVNSSLAGSGSPVQTNAQRVNPQAGQLASPNMGGPVPTVNAPAKKPGALVSAADLMKKQYELQLPNAGTLGQPTNYTPQPLVQPLNSQNGVTYGASPQFDPRLNEDAIQGIKTAQSDVVNNAYGGALTPGINPFNRSLLTDYLPDIKSDLKRSFEAGDVLGTLGNGAGYVGAAALAGFGDVTLLAGDNLIARPLRAAGVPTFQELGFGKNAKPEVNKPAVSNAAPAPQAGATTAPNDNAAILAKLNELYGSKTSSLGGGSSSSQSELLKQLLAQNNNATLGVNMPQGQFNRGNLEQNYMNALNAPGTQIDTGKFNEMTQGFMGQNGEDLAKVEAQKQGIFDRLNEQKKASVDFAQQALTSDPLQAMMLLGRAKGAGKEASRLSQEYSGLISSDNKLAKDQQNKLVEQMLEAEKLRTFKQPEFAQELAKTNLTAQNQTDLNMQSFDKRMQELGLTAELSNASNKQTRAMDIAKEMIKEKAPENSAKTLMSNLQLGVMNSLMASQQAAAKGDNIGAKAHAMQAERNKEILSYLSPKPASKEEPHKIKIDGEEYLISLSDGSPKQPQIDAHVKNIKLQNLMARLPSVRNDKKEYDNLMEQINTLKNSK